MKRINVLIVEDDFRVGRVIRGFTERVEAFKVVGEARSGEEALKRIHQLNPDLVVMDVYIPDMDGIEVLHEIKKQALPIDVIMISAAKEMPQVKQALHLGVIDYILKPFIFERYEYSLLRYLYRFRGYLQPECTQESLDQMLYGEKDHQRNPTSQLPKGLQKATLERIEKFLEASPVSQSVENISQTTGLSKATIQRYLRFLEETRKVDKDLTYGSKGRPEHRYIYRT